MKTMHKRLVATTAIAALLAVPMAATAQTRDQRGSGYRGGYHQDNTGAYVGLGLGALALGSVLAYSATQPTYAAPPAYYYAPAPAYAYYPPPPAYYAPAPAYSYYPSPAAYYAPGYYDPYTASYRPYPSYDRGSN